MSHSLFAIVDMPSGGVPTTVSAVLFSPTIHALLFLSAGIGPRSLHTLGTFLPLASSTMETLCHISLGNLGWTSLGSPDLPGTHLFTFATKVQ